MNTFVVENLRAKIDIRHYFYPRLCEEIYSFSSSFSFGKCYCINTQIGDGGWATSWGIAGTARVIRSRFFIDGTIVPKVKSISCAVGASEYYLFKERTVRSILERNLSSRSNYSLSDLQDLFLLSPERLDRPLSCYSAERIRAGVAIGVSRDACIFCFPWIRNDFIAKYQLIWFSDMIKKLKNMGLLIIIPTAYDDRIKGLFDEVISL